MMTHVHTRSGRSRIALALLLAALAGGGYLVRSGSITLPSSLSANPSDPGVPAEPEQDYNLEELRKQGESDPELAKLYWVVKAKQLEQTRKFNREYQRKLWGESP